MPRNTTRQHRGFRRDVLLGSDVGPAIQPQLQDTESHVQDESEGFSFQGDYVESNLFVLQRSCVCGSGEMRWQSGSGEVSAGASVH